MLALVEPSLARFCMAMKLGIAIAARMPMMTTTIISSIRVKPFCDLTMMLFLLLCRFGAVPPHDPGPALLPSGQYQVEGGGRAVAFDIEARLGPAVVGVARHPGGGGRRPGQRRPVLPRLVRADRAVERLLDIGTRARPQ